MYRLIVDAAQINAHRALDGATNVNVDGLVSGRQGVSDIGEALAIVDNALAAELEGEDAVLLVAVRLLNGKAGDGAEVENGGAHRINIVVAGLEGKVVEVDGANFLVKEVVVESSVAKLESNLGVVGDPDGTEEVVDAGRSISLGVDGGVVNKGSIKQTEAGHINGLLEGDAIGPVDTLDVNLGVTLDGNLESLVVQEPGVEGGESFQIVNHGELGNVYDLGLVAVGLGELDPGERLVLRQILQVHDTLERLDSGLDLSVTPDLSVDGHGEVLSPGVGHDDAVKDELGMVELLLSDLGDTNKDDNRDDDDNDNNDRDQVGPPKLQAVAGAASLARLVDDILRLSVLGLVIHLEGFFLGFDAVR